MSDKSTFPFPFATGAYMGVKDYFNAEDVMAGLSLPLLSKLMGSSANWKEGVKGFVNQILSRNIVIMVGPTLNVLPLENMLMKKSGSESFYRTMSKGTVASLIAGAIGPAIGDTLPAYS